MRMWFAGLPARRHGLKVKGWGGMHVNAPRPSRLPHGGAHPHITPASRPQHKSLSSSTQAPSKAHAPAMHPFAHPRPFSTSHPASVHHKTQLHQAQSAASSHVPRSPRRQHIPRAPRQQPRVPARAEQHPAVGAERHGRSGVAVAHDVAHLSQGNTKGKGHGVVTSSCRQLVAAVVVSGGVLGRPPDATWQCPTRARRRPRAPPPARHRRR
jgi:hypothetical protein